MINKKIFFSLMTMPVAIMCHNSSEWQSRRAEEKVVEGKRRAERLADKATDITPKDGTFAFHGMSPEQIEDEYGFKRVKVKGLLDLESEVRIPTVHRGERGYLILNPLYTHVNDKKEPCGIVVNRGFLPIDFEHSRAQMAYHRDGYFEGVVYCGDHLTKYDDYVNAPAAHAWRKAVPHDLALHFQLGNRDDSGKAMLMLVEFDEEHQTVMPSAPTVSDLTHWKNTPERHTAYSIFWKYTTYLNLFANTMFWLYF